MAVIATHLPQWAEDARNLGREHGTSAASWVADGNSEEASMRRLLTMLDDGDPEADDYLPPRPTLSGEWADGMTPRSLFEYVTGFDAHAEASFNADAYNGVVDALCEAYEAGVDETFTTECERVLHAFVD